MSTPLEPRPVDVGLAVLYADLLNARSALQIERCARQRLPASRSAAADLLVCLETYAAELAARHLPVPPGIRDELRLRRRLSKAGR